MNLKATVIIILTAFVTLLLTVNHLLLSALKKEKENVAIPVYSSIPKVKRDITGEERQVESELSSAPRRRHELVPEDPAKYGIVTIPKNHMIRDQFYWDKQMTKIVVDSGVLKTKEGEAAVEKMKVSRVEFDDRVVKINKEIDQFEKEREKNPLDSNTEKRLQTLYQLKALSKIMEEKTDVITSSSSPSIPSQETPETP